MTEIQIIITPSGRLLVTDAAKAAVTNRQTTSGNQQKRRNADNSQSLVHVTEICSAFELSNAVGILAIQKMSPDSSELQNASIRYWQQFGNEFFQRICQLPETDFKRWARLPIPDEPATNQLIVSAPPMRGLEFLTARLIHSLWRELAIHVAEEAATYDEPTDFLRSINSQFHLLGRVTFHLAENKADSQRPFAFMATYTHRVSKTAKLQHLPLGQAIKQYAGANNRETLQALLTPVRRAAERDPLMRELLDSKAIFHPQAWTVQQAHRLLLAGPVLESCGLVLRLPDWWKSGRSQRVVVQVAVGDKQPSRVGTDSLIKFSSRLALDGEELTKGEAKRLLASDESLVMLRGKWIEVDKAKLQQALDHWTTLSQSNPDGIDFLSGMRLIAGVSVEANESELEINQDWQFVSAGKWLREKLADLREPDNTNVISQKGIPGLNAELRSYQTVGVQWLRFLSQLGTGGCLADDMGLGKTVQVIALLLLLKTGRRNKSSASTNQEKPNLLIVPASLVGNWRQEIERFAPSLEALYAHRSETPAEQLDKLAAKPQLTKKYDLTITTYGLARRWKWLADIDWNLVVLDEAQAIKNATSAQTKAIKKLHSQANFALTGTPVENNLGDLWSLFDFCCPGLLGSAKQFRSYVNRLHKSERPQPFASTKKIGAALYLASYENRPEDRTRFTRENRNAMRVYIDQKTGCPLSKGRRATKASVNSG